MFNRPRPGAFRTCRCPSAIFICWTFWFPWRSWPQELIWGWNVRELHRVGETWAGIGSLILVEQHDSPSYCLAFFPHLGSVKLFLVGRKDDSMRWWFEGHSPSINDKGSRVGVSFKERYILQMVSAFELYVGVFRHRRFLTERRNQRFFDPWITHLHDVKILAVAFCSLLSCNIALLSWQWSTKSEYSRIYPQSHWYSGLRWVEYAPLFRSSLGYCSDQKPDPGRPFRMRQASDCKRWLLIIVEISFMVFELSSNIFGGLLDEFGSSFSFFRCFFRQYY